MKYQIAKYYMHDPVKFEKANTLKKALIYGELVNNNTIKEIFDEDFGDVDTPVGQVSMGELMLSCLSQNDIDNFTDYFAEMTAEYLEEEEDWFYNSEYCDAYRFDKQTLILRYYETESEKKKFRKTYSNEYVNAVCNRMEGEH